MKLISTSTWLYAILAITFSLTGCQRAERPDELEMISESVLKHHRGIVIDIEPGQAEK